MIRKVIITQDGVYFKKVRYEDVKLSEVFITREIVLKWISKTKNNIVKVCAEGETVELTPMNIYNVVSSITKPNK
jgi:hypothetical protein